MEKVTLKVSIAVFLCLLFVFSLLLPPWQEKAFAESEFLKGYKGELLASFSTEFSTSGESRKHNVKRATELIDGAVVREGEIFSFNALTGERSIENGYKESPVIEFGKYTLGIGGGVCQVSTTLYNAVLLAGLKVVAVSPHSLPVGYVPPSMDAMVSKATDFRFFNDTPYPIRIEGRVKNNTLTFKIYGFKTLTDGEKIVFRSVVKEQLKGEYEEVEDKENLLEEGEEYRILKKAKNGLISECYKEVYYRGELQNSVCVRRDLYKAEKGVKLVRKAEEKIL